MKLVLINISCTNLLDHSVFHKYLSACFQSQKLSAKYKSWVNINSHAESLKQGLNTPGLEQIDTGVEHRMPFLPVLSQV